MFKTAARTKTIRIHAFLSILVSLILPLQVNAKTVVLVHGFLSNASIWHQAGFTQTLQRSGFVYGGNYNFNPWGMVIPRHINIKHDALYTLELPSETNLQTQEGILLQYLQHLYSERKEPITLVGHSAGGVVARLYAIDPKHVPLNGLISIASPHLGTPTANIGLLAGNSPIGMMASFAGEDRLQDSRGLLSDLREEQPGNFMHWMNHQPHPDIHFASIVRKNETISKPNKFDFIVPPFSQNMNNIWVLKGRSGVAITTDNHALNYKDALIVIDVLKHIKG